MCSHAYVHVPVCIHAGIYVIVYKDAFARTCRICTNCIRVGKQVCAAVLASRCDCHMHASVSLSRSHPSVIVLQYYITYNPKGPCTRLVYTLGQSIYYMSTWTLRVSAYTHILRVHVSIWVYFDPKVPI